MPPKDQPSRRSSTSSRSEGQSRRPPPARQLITFVDSQDPNSRSAIQRHTAHHSNAQRRDARLRSLRSNRPRLLEWQRRPSGDVDAVSVTSPQSSTSSTSISPAPALPPPLSAPGNVPTEQTSGSVSSPEKTASHYRPALEGDSTTDPSILDDAVVEYYLQHVCPFASENTLRSLLHYIQASCTASECLVSAYILACKGAADQSSPTESDRNDAQRLYGRGTRLLRDGLTNPKTASSDENIQAVLLLIAYAADTGSTEEVPIHVAALSRMIKQRGGLEALEADMDSTLKLQVQGISRSRRRHLTFDCGAGCPYELRFPGGMGLLDMQDKT